MHQVTSVSWSIVGCVVLLGCAASQPVPESAAQPAHSNAISVPLVPEVRELPRTRVATDLQNPRGVEPLPDGSLLVATAGTGDPANPNTGALLRLVDVNRDGDFDDEGERTTLLANQPSKNLLDIVRRDEVFGLAGIASGDGQVLVSLAFFGGPSTIYRVQDQSVTRWSITHGNVNDLTYDPDRKAWFGVASTSDEVVELHENEGMQRVVKLPALASGQDSVPANLVHDPLTHDLLVSLFSGSPEGEEGGKGVEIVPRAASIVRVKPEAHAAEAAVTELTVPTDLEATPDGKIYVLEFCDAFLDPVKTREDMAAGPLHGGFRRFSGRLLQIDRKTGAVAVIARGLDAPTNLARSGNVLYVSEGMGTPGRQIPGPDGAPRTLTGFLERIELPNP